MPSKSKSQQRLFGMALAVRRGEMERSEVGNEVLEIVDSDMTTSEIERFATERTSDRERVTEGNSPEPVQGSVENAKGVSNRMQNKIVPKQGRTPIQEYLMDLKYSGRMKPMISVAPEKKYVFVVVKPGFSGVSKNIIDQFSEEGFSLYKVRTKMLSLREAKRLYYVHKDEPFYGDLCKYMSSDYSIGILFEYPSQWKEDKVFNKVGKIKDEIREKYGESDMRNVMHSSDNAQDMRFECSLYFNELF